MRSALVFIWAMMAALHSFGQRNVIDSLQIALKKERTDTGKALTLYQLSYAYQEYKPDSALLLAEQVYDISTHTHFLKGESRALNAMGSAFREMGNNAQALTYYLQQLKIEEERNFPDNLALVNMNIAFVYNHEKDTANAIFYILKADSIISFYKLADMEQYGLLNTGDIFEKAGRLSDALMYTEKSYALALKNNDSLMIGSSLNNLGNIYLKERATLKAIKSYLLCEPYLKARNDNQSLSESMLGLAKAYNQSAIPDSALMYANSAYSLSAENGFLKNALASGQLLAQLYKKQDNSDSAFRYLQITADLKDSLESLEKIKQVQSMSIAEQLRQQHLAALAQQEKEERRQKLELLAIGILIPLCFLISMYISKRRVSPRLIEFSGIVSLLLLFEYITLFIHPFVANLTHHSPLLEIIILVAIAALVVPAHHRIQHLFTKRLAVMHEMHMQKKPVTVMKPDGGEVLDEPATTPEEKPINEADPLPSGEQDSAPFENLID